MTTTAQSPDPQIQALRTRFRHSPLFLLGLITLLAGALRFMALDRPALWGDEAWTFSRICGTYQEMLDLVSLAGFAPLHYELYWWIGQHAKLSPIMMRLVPALAGTLMIPAIYFLARQFVGVRTALLTALLASVSAYLLVYSRDAKMYMHFWLACTLSVACLLWWLRNPTRIRWYCWVAASIAMVGLHAPGMILLGVEALFFLSHPHLHWKRAIAFVAGVAVVVSGFSIYYARFSKLKDRVVVERSSRDTTQPSYEIQLGRTGIFWVPWYNAGRSGPGLVLYATSAFLFSWEYPQPGQVASIPPRTYKTLVAATWAIIALLVLGIFPWRARRSDPQAHAADQPWWRSLLWIGCWIVVPAYAFYCISIPNYPTPLDWLRQLFARRGLYLATGILLGLVSLYFCARTWRARGTKAGLLAMVIAIIWLLCAGIAIGFKSGKSESVWLPRYLGVIWPAVMIAVATLFLRLPTRWLRALAIGLFIGINLLQFGWRVFGQSEPPTALLARDVIDAQAKDSTTRTYTKLSRLPGVEPGEGVIGSPAFRYYLAARSNVPVEPRLFQLAPYRRGGSNEKFEDRFRFWPPIQNPMMQAFVNLATFIPTDLKAAKSVNRVVVWELFDSKDADLAQQDRLKPQLPGWRRVSQDQFWAYDHWRWRRLYLSRRSVYERVPA